VYNRKALAEFNKKNKEEKMAKLPHEHRGVPREQ